MTALEEVAAAVGTGRGRTVTELRDVLRSTGRVSITQADVTRVLTSHPHRFEADGNTPPRWWSAGSAPTSNVRHAGPNGGFELYSWQSEAIDAWRRAGGRGVVEAVTGTGKTVVGVVAACDELARGGQVLVLVPTRELADQWSAVLALHGPRHARLGRLGGGHRDDLGSHDIVVAVVNSARDVDLRPRRPGGLLVADECHRYGSDGNRVALHARFGRRLGLSATYARADDGHVTWLDPYFGGVCFRMGYGRAIGDGVIARFAVALIGVEFSAPERADYDELTVTMSACRGRLIAAGLVPADPVGAFLAAVARLARGGDGPGALLARRYLGAMQERRRLLAETPAKSAALDTLTPALHQCDRAIVFTQSVVGADGAAARLRSRGMRAASIHSQLDATTRRAVLRRFGAGDLRAVVAPQVLDEGVDVPAADLAVILAASRSRRQMVQRMGRVLRRKADGRSARFAIVFVEGTSRIPRSAPTTASSTRSRPSPTPCARSPPGHRPIWATSSTRRRHEADVLVIGRSFLKARACETGGSSGLRELPKMRPSWSGESRAARRSRSRSQVVSRPVWSRSLRDGGSGGTRSPTCSAGPPIRTGSTTSK